MTCAIEVWGSPDDSKSRIVRQPRGHRMHQPSARRMPKCHPVLLLGRASKTPQALGDFNLHSELLELRNQ